MSLFFPSFQWDWGKSCNRYQSYPMCIQDTEVLFICFWYSTTLMDRIKSCRLNWVTSELFVLSSDCPAHNCAQTTLQGANFRASSDMLAAMRDLFLSAVTSSQRNGASNRKSCLVIACWVKLVVANRTGIFLTCKYLANRMIETNVTWEHDVQLTVCI
jgi:hypothetical protein